MPVADTATKRVGTQRTPTRTLAFDPGTSSGYATLDTNPRHLSDAGVITLDHDPTNLTTNLSDLIADTLPDRIIIEGWESHGRVIDIHSSVPNMVIGIIIALAVTHTVPYSIAFSSVWKREYSSGAAHLPAPSSRVRAPDEGLARALQHDLGAWPEALERVPRAVRSHAISAAGLALWSLRLTAAELSASRSNPRPKRDAATGETRAATVWRQTLARQP